MLSEADGTILVSQQHWKCHSADRLCCFGGQKAQSSDAAMERKGADAPNRDVDAASLIKACTSGYAFTQARGHANSKCKFFHADTEHHADIYPDTLPVCVLFLKPVNHRLNLVSSFCQALPRESCEKWCAHMKLLTLYAAMFFQWAGTY